MRVDLLKDNCWSLWWDISNVQLQKTHNPQQICCSFLYFCCSFFNAALWFPQPLEPVVNSAFSLLLATNTDKTRNQPSGSVKCAVSEHTHTHSINYAGCKTPK